ncbi:MAG: SET domain-containing protein-lysine N-methyltransferase [Burkholderiales bacterium]
MLTNPKKSSQVKAPKRKASVSRAKRFVARNSPIHGRGVFALQRIKKGERIVEYKGRLITEAEADRRYPDNDAKPAHTFLFLIEDAMVIDANHNGNSARWLNHSCAPNCETDEDNGHVFIDAIRDIEPGIELVYDYNLVLDEPLTKALRERYRCLCGTRKCRGTMFGTDRYKPPKKKSVKKKSARKA